MFLYVLLLFADFLRMIKIELICCSYEKFYVKNNNFKIFLFVGMYYVIYITLLLQSLGLRGWLLNDNQNSSKMKTLSPNKSYRVSVSLYFAARPLM